MLPHSYELPAAILIVLSGTLACFAGYRLFKDYGCMACHQGIAVGGNMFQRMGLFGDYFAVDSAAPQVDLAIGGTPGQAAALEAASGQHRSWNCSWSLQEARRSKTEGNKVYANAGARIIEALIAVNDILAKSGKLEC